MNDNKHKYGFFCTLHIEDVDNYFGKDTHAIFEKINEALQKEGLDAFGLIEMTFYEYPPNYMNKKGGKKYLDNIKKAWEKHYSNLDEQWY